MTASSRARAARRDAIVDWERRELESGERDRTSANNGDKLSNTIRARLGNDVGMVLHHRGLRWTKFGLYIRKIHRDCSQQPATSDGALKQLRARV